MSKCIDCNQEQTIVESCDRDHFSYIIRDGMVFKRDTTWFDALERCNDCGVVNKEGNLHHYGCDIERCPCCHGQLISCDCTPYGGIDDEDFVGTKEECIVALKKKNEGYNTVSTPVVPENRVVQTIPKKQKKR